MAGALDTLVEATPTSRDRVVDLLRAASIGVVVLWHWSFSITQWNTNGALTMPNFIGDVPGLWALTWVMQVMPVFFLVCGYANLAGWQAVTVTEAARGSSWSRACAGCSCRWSRCWRPGRSSTS